MNTNNNAGDNNKHNKDWQKMDANNQGGDKVPKAGGGDEKEPQPKI